MTSDWQPTASLQNLKARAVLLDKIRSYFADLGVMEVETPLLSRSGNSDPEIQTMMTANNHYLRTSPEFPLKRLLAAGSGDIFELGRVFRAGESGRQHNPEFTMLEWYRTSLGYHALIDEVAALVLHCGQGKFDHWPVQKLSYRELFSRFLKIDPFTAETDELVQTAARHGISGLELDKRQWLDLLLSHFIQPGLAEKSLTFVYDYPADQAALANVRQDSPAVAERFELYLGQTELANGYQELTDATEQKCRFENDNAVRRQRGAPVYSIDDNLLAALTHGIPHCAGVALGVDRLLMAICGVNRLDEVIAFPHSRA